MGRVHKRKDDARRYNSLSQEKLEEALEAILQKKMSITAAAKYFKIAKGTLINRIHKRHDGKFGKPTTFSNEEEIMFVTHIVEVAKWGFPFDSLDLRMFVKHYLDRSKRTVPKFVNNMPGQEWARSFLKRHKAVLTLRNCQNIKQCKASVSAKDIEEYFKNIQETMEDVPPQNVFNFDETNLCDDPGVKKCIFKRGTKYPERIRDSTKSSISLMFCGSATGHLLPPYVVYKSKHIWKSWMEGGPQKTRYNCSKSGWFDSTLFTDWFELMFIPETRKLQGKVVLIGDNLSSHFTMEVIRLADHNNISFVCLPANTTHICQPLDVAFYAPLKRYWRRILDNWKKGLKKKSQTITKEAFPKLLKDLYEKVFQEEKSGNLIAGFEKCGIFPFNPNKVLERLPERKQINSEDIYQNVSEAVLDMLKNLRGGDEVGTSKRQRRVKVKVKPGRSVTLEDFTTISDADLEEIMEKSSETSVMGEELDELPLARLCNPLQSYRIKPNQNDYVIIKLETVKQTYKHYIGLIKEETDAENWHVKFLKNRGNKFVWPDQPDESEVHVNQIIKILSPPDQLKRGYRFNPQELENYTIY